MALVAVRINSIIGEPFDEDGDIKDDGWEISDKQQTFTIVDTSDVFDILNGLEDVRDGLENWSDSDGESTGSGDPTPSGG